MPTIHWKYIGHYFRYNGWGKKKLWTEESMEAATRSVLNENRSLREASRLYNVPTILKARHITVSWLNPNPISDICVKYEANWSSSSVNTVAGQGLHPGITYTCTNRRRVLKDRTQCKHPFKDQKAGQAWFDGFCCRHPGLTICAPQPVSYFHAQSANMETITVTRL